MHERLRWLKQIDISKEYGIKQDPEMETMLKTYFSRHANKEEKEQRKLLKTFSERFATYLKNKQPCQIQPYILNMETIIYTKVIHNLKKILRYLHQRLQQVTI